MAQHARAQPTGDWCCPQGACSRQLLTRPRSPPPPQVTGDTRMWMWRSRAAAERAEWLVPAAACGAACWHGTASRAVRRESGHVGALTWKSVPGPLEEQGRPVATPALVASWSVRDPRSGPLAQGSAPPPGTGVGVTSWHGGQRHLLAQSHSQTWPRAPGAACIPLPPAPLQPLGGTSAGPGGMCVALGCAPRRGRQGAALSVKGTRQGWWPQGHSGWRAEVPERGLAGRVSACRRRLGRWLSGWEPFLGTRGVRVCGSFRNTEVPVQSARVSYQVKGCLSLRADLTQVEANAGPARPCACTGVSGVHRCVRCSQVCQLCRPGPRGVGSV